MKLTNRGAIDAIDLPDDWLLGEEQYLLDGMASYIQSTLPENEEVGLALFERAQDYISIAPSFKAMLDAPAHEVSQEDMEKLGPVLGNYLDSRAFEADFCHTEILNGKTVLVIKGTWLSTKHKSLSVIVATDNSGERVQEIYYKAPQSLFDLYFETAMQSLKSIGWK